VTGRICAADGAVLAVDGYFRILGRVDDVINVAGPPPGHKEIESACLTVPEVAEARGRCRGGRNQRPRSRSLYRPATPGIEASPENCGKGHKVIETMIGKIARPRRILVVPDMPKTRSGKLMRRVLAAVSNNHEY